MLIQIIGIGCEKCMKLEENARQAVQEMRIDADIGKVGNLDEISDMGVMTTPAFAVDGVVLSQGKVLSVNEIKEMLEAEEEIS
jgi:small redox-active disulfide protein 2